jgi:hypothetical protein
MWRVKNTTAAAKRSKTASGEDGFSFIEYCYQEWDAPTRWIVKSSEGSVPYKNPKKEK